MAHWPVSVQESVSGLVFECFCDVKPNCLNTPFCPPQMCWDSTTPTASSRPNASATVLRSCFLIIYSPRRTTGSLATTWKWSATVSYNKDDVIRSAMFSRSESTAWHTWFEHVVFYLETPPSLLSDITDPRFSAHFIFTQHWCFKQAPNKWAGYTTAWYGVNKQLKPVMFN